MDETAARKALLAAVLGSKGGRATLVVLDAAPIHSLWIARHLHLLVGLNLTVVIPKAIRGIFAAHQDCRKGREVLDFLDRHTPPLVIRPDGLPELYGGLDHAQDADPCSAPLFALVGSPMKWRKARALEHVHFVDVRNLAVVAESIGLLGSVLEIAHAIELPGEVVAWR